MILDEIQGFVDVFGRFLLGQLLQPLVQVKEDLLGLEIQSDSPSSGYNLRASLELHSAKTEHWAKRISKINIKIHLIRALQQRRQVLRDLGKRHFSFTLNLLSTCFERHLQRSF